MFKSTTGARASRSFSKDSASTKRRQYPRSMLIEVTGYDIHERDGSVGVVIGKRLSDGQEVEISIKKDKVDAQQARIKADTSKKTDAGSWHGALINADMRDQVPAASWIVAENALFQKAIKIPGGQRLAYEANWIHASPGASPDKAIQGIMTSDTPSNGHVNNIQVWGKALSITNNADEVHALIEKYGQIANSWDEEAHLPRHGFAMRAVVRNGESREIYNEAEGKRVPTEVATVIDTTYPNEWIYERGEEGEEPKQNRPINGDDLGADVDGYSGYIEERFPDQEVDIEVLPYDSYFTSRTHNSFRVSEYGALKDMATTPILLAQQVPGEDPEEPSVGKNYAVHGILLIIDDKVDKDPKTRQSVLKEQFMAQKFFGNAGSYSGPLHSMLRTADDMPVSVVAELEAPRRERSTPAPAAAADQRAAAANEVSGGFDDLPGDVGTPFGDDAAAATEFGDAFSVGDDAGAADNAATDVADDTAEAVADPSEEAPAPAAGARRRFGKK